MSLCDFIHKGYYYKKSNQRLRGNKNILKNVCRISILLSILTFIYLKSLIFSKRYHKVLSRDIVKYTVFVWNAAKDVIK